MAAVFVIVLIAYALSNHRIAKLESQVAIAKTIANEKQQTATAKELEAAEYKQKIDYLEVKLDEINQLARKQDEELKQLNNSSSDARVDVGRARRTRTITTTAAELCEKLAELGHACE